MTLREEARDGRASVTTSGERVLLSAWDVTVIVRLLLPIRPSPLHSFTLNSKRTLLVKSFHHRSLTIDTRDWLPRLMGPFYVSTVFIGFSSWFWCGRLNQFSSFLVHTKIGNFIIIIKSLQFMVDSFWAQPAKLISSVGCLPGWHRVFGPSKVSCNGRHYTIFDSITLACLTIFSWFGVRLQCRQSSFLQKLWNLVAF